MNRHVTSPQSLSLRLPRADRSLESFTLSQPKDFPARQSGKLNRVAYAAAHVVADPLADIDPWLGIAVDWDRTLAFREHLWDLGLGIAEAMDTAQRGMGVDWKHSLELIQRSVAAGKARELARGPGQGVIASGAGTDHLAPEDAKSVDDVIRAYEEQVEAIEAAGGRIILMASRALAQVARGPDDYAKVYGRILSQLREPTIIHWLGDMFDPALKGYWGSADLGQAMNTAVAIINDHAAKVDGVKISLLDKDKEIAMRRRLAKGVRMYTGDDFNYAELIAGDAQGHSDALLGIFDVIAPAASAALAKLAAGDRAGFDAILEPTVPLSRQIFRAPTRFYKTGVVFMAYLNGHQDHFTMVGGQESTRSAVHLAEIFRLADKAGLLRDPSLAVARMRAVLATRGIDA
ncbi:MAG: dihydrodipicolinate synthase family protein [Pseudolabrys sp.]|nr:dihydrodipicolinate synthase family protein [Pseudolabrys sp.]